MSRATVLLVAALLPAAAPTAIAQTASASQRAFAPARQAVDAAIAAHGGLDALRAIKDVQRIGSATVHNQGQSLRPGTPYTTRTVTWKTVHDFAKGRSRSEQTGSFSGGIPSMTRTVLRGDEGFSLSLATNVVTPMTAGGVTGAKTALRRDPATLLLTAAARAETLRDLGDATFDGRRHRVVTFADADGTQIALYLDGQSRRVSKIETIADHSILGDTVSEVVFSDYRPVNNVQLPYRVVTRVGGEVVQDLVLSEVKANSSPTDPMFEPPGRTIAAKPLAGATTVVANKLADGVIFLEGSSHNSLAVVMPDSVLLIEAPQSEERSLAVIKKLAELAPGKSIKQVVMTHYHYDHSGGLRTHIARGATIFTTGGNREFLTKLAAAPHVIKPDMLSRAPATPLVEVVAGKKVIGDKDHVVELYEVGPGPHVDEMLVAYLPKEKLLFVSDIITIPPTGPMPAGTPANRDLAEKLKKLAIEVQVIAPGHGRMGTIKDLQTALETPPPR